MLAIIVAMTKNRVIGDGGAMPWHLPAELAYFRRITQGKTVIMGRKTYESIGSPLPNRKNIVLTRNADWQVPGVQCYASLAEAVEATATDSERFIIGGGTVYAQALDQVDRLYLTEIQVELPGDTQFPEWRDNTWRLLSTERVTANEANVYDFDCHVYER